MPGRITNDEDVVDAIMSFCARHDYLSVRWLLTNLLGLSDQEVDQLETEVRRERLTPLQRFAEEVWDD